MWYVTLLEYLATRICPKDAANAVLFMNNWIRLLENEFYDTGCLELSVITGLATDLHKYSKENQGRGRSLAQFAQKCVGLTLLHVKSTEDDSVYSSDFIYMLNSEHILESLDVEKQILAMRKQYLLGTKTHRKVKSLSSLTDLNMYVDNRTVLNAVLLTDILNDCERRAFKDLDYLVKADINNLAPLLNEFLNQTEHPEKFLTNLYIYLLPYRNRDQTTSIRQLIDAIRRYSKALDSDANKSERPRGHDRREPEKFTESGRRKEGSLNSSRLQSGKKRNSSIKFNLIPRLDLDLLPRYNPEIINLCTALEAYSEKIPENRYSFYTHNFRKYKSEVELIVCDILKGNLLSVAAIVRELKKINIASTDELWTIIDLYDKTVTEKSMAFNSKM
ncbi:hypothetical protein [Legionella shakespearei]|uniref:Uncharacterized protein n=1 Tax=Legionella shakespearei DSM 23087 TaxID=1122169 RepID=A0A0W0YQD8_9GAMM|nr:hypothetical protein [Legionella shakespearei]KTD59089.1 hypothetical protein Lsha_2016 [Legionella shakespearei DSM 23087]